MTQVATPVSPRRSPTGRAALVRTLVAVALASALNGALELSGRGLRLWISDQFAYAAAARSLLAGDGFQDAEIRGPWLALAHENGVEITRDTVMTPDLFRPGWPLMLAGVFAVLGPSDAAYQALNLLMYALLGVLVFLIAHRLGGRLAAMAAFGLFLCHNELLNGGFFAGMELGFCAALVGAVAFLLLGRGYPSAVLGAALFAWALFMRPTAIAFFPLVLVALCGIDDRPAWRRLGVAVLSLVALCAVVSVADSAMRPAPLVPGKSVSLLAQSLLYETASYPHESAQHAYYTPSLELVGQLRREVLSKVARNLAAIADGASVVCPVFLIAFVPLGFIVRSVRTRGTDLLALAAGLSWAAIALIAALTFVRSAGRYQLPIPLVLMPFAGVGIVALYQHFRAKWGRWAVVIPLVVFLAAGLYRATDVARVLTASNRSPREFRLAEAVERLVPEGDLVAVRDLVAISPRGAMGWYANRRTVVMPWWPEKYGELFADTVRADVFITSMTSPAFEIPMPGVPPEDWVPGFRLVDTIKLQDDYRGEIELGVWRREK